MLITEMQKLWFRNAERSDPHAVGSAGTQHGIRPNIVPKDLLRHFNKSRTFR